MPPHSFPDFTAKLCSKPKIHSESYLWPIPSKHLDSLQFPWTHLDSLGLTWTHWDSLGACEGKDKVPKQMAVIVSDGNKKDSIIEEEYLENVEANIIEDTEFIEDTVIIETVESIELIEEQSIELGPRFFHIVIGSFEQEKNALSFVQGLENQNSETKIIQHNGIYRVSFNSYFDSDEAEIEIDYIRNTLNLKSWIAYMK